MNTNMNYETTGTFLQLDIDIPVDVQPAMELYFKRLGHFLIDEAKRRCPVITGRLRNSIGNTSGEGIFEYDGTSVIIGSNVEYAGYVEEGHYSGKSNNFIGGAHYLKRAVYENEAKINQFIQSSILEVMTGVEPEDEEVDDL